jgi:hypothetical protein
MKVIALVLLAAPFAHAEDSGGAQKLPEIRRIFVDRLTGGEAAEQMRDLLIGSLHNTRLFVLTENVEKADAILRGAAEDLIYTEQFAASDGVNLRASTGALRSTARSAGTRAMSIGVSDDESISLHERKHEALATVRLVNREGDVIWSTTQESSGAKFRGANADVAEKVTRQLMEDYGRLTGSARASIP